MTWLTKRQFAESLGQIAAGLLVIMLTSLLAAAVGLICLHAAGRQLLSVQSASMVPSFRPGDALIVEPVKAQSLKVGQVISYRSPRVPQLIISHRLIQINNKTGLLITSGDALHSHDQPFSNKLLVGRAVAVVPGFGRLLNLLRRPLGLIIAIYLPATAVAGYELTRLAYRYLPPAYRLHTWP